MTRISRPSRTSAHIDQRLITYADPCAAPQPAAIFGCKHCPWSPPDMSRNATRLQPYQHTRGSTLPWFLCLSKPNDMISEQNVVTARTAIVSALLNAPSLVPHVVIMHLPDQNTEDNDNFTEWLRQMNVPLVRHRLSFIDAFPPDAWKTRASNYHHPYHVNIGAYCRMDLPLIARDFSPKWRRLGIETERYLYTDTDVLFSNDVSADDIVDGRLLATFAGGTEVFSPDFNSGVLLVNASALFEELPAMRRYAKERAFKFFLQDQQWMAEYFTPNPVRLSAGRAAFWRDWHFNVSKRVGWLKLRDSRWNARAYAHPHETEQFPAIWHWHGYKITDVECWLKYLTNSSFELEHYPSVHGRNNIFRRFELRGKCKFIDVISHKHTSSLCWLRTYTWLRAMQLRMDELAATVLSPPAR